MPAITEARNARPHDVVVIRDYYRPSYRPVPYVSCSRGGYLPPGGPGASCQCRCISSRSSCRFPTDIVAASSTATLWSTTRAASSSTSPQCFDRARVRRGGSRPAPTIDDNGSALHHNLHVEEVVIKSSGSPSTSTISASLPALERSEVLAFLDERGGVRSHQLNDVLRRKHQTQRAQLVLQSFPGRYPVSVPKP